MSKTLDTILSNHGAEEGELTESLKQTILRWVADEVIGQDELNYIQRPPMFKVEPSNGRSGDEIDYLLEVNTRIDKDYERHNEAIVRYKLRNEQRKILAQHGYKGDQR